MEKYIETLIHFASSGRYQPELLVAREEYFAKMGQVSEEEDNYEAKLRGFIDWYLFDRPLADTGKPPVDVFYEKFIRTFSEEDEQIYGDFRKSIQSLFIVKKSDENGVTVKDLISKKKYFVEDEMPEGFFKEEIFQGRLILFRDGYRFGDAFCFHPQAVNKIILKRAKNVDSENPAEIRAFLDDLFYRRIKGERYRHIDVIRFYEEKE